MKSYTITQTELHLECNPFELFLWINQRYQSDICLLESSFLHDEIGRYSIIGFDALHHFRCDYQTDLNAYYQTLEQIIQTYHLDIQTELPFLSGLIGYFSYDAFLINPKLKAVEFKSDAINIPLSYFYLFRHIVLFDHRQHAITLSTIHEDQAFNHQHILDFLKAFDSSFIQALHLKLLNEKSSNELQISSDFDQEHYLQAIEKTRDYIHDGHIYVMNLTQQLSCETDKSALAIYAQLRQINPSPFGGLFLNHDFQLISSSPERFLNIQNKQIETRPIKGTSRRYPNDLTQDEFSKQALLNSQKDKSELLMIVDLERNDFNQFCEFHSVNVTELYHLESYATVHHLVSIIQGKIKEKHSMLDCFRQCFVGGSITGAPKQRAIEIINELEQHSRSAYTGCFGYFSFHDTCDFNILIRTIILKNQTAFFGVGGGITWESEAIAEFEETLLKAKALIESLK